MSYIGYYEWYTDSLKELKQNNLWAVGHTKKMEVPRKSPKHILYDR